MPLESLAAPGAVGEDGGAGVMELKLSMVILWLLLLGLWSAVLQDVTAMADERG